MFCLNRKLYVAFIDFEKSFDFINRKLLWPVLLKNGINGKLYHCIKSMYNSVKVRVRCGCEMTDYINCTFGVKEGDVRSPFLFSLFIDELALKVITPKSNWILMSVNHINFGYLRTTPERPNSNWKTLKLTDNPLIRKMN